MTVPSILIVLSASIVLMLGIAHLVFTFRGPKLSPRDPECQGKMMAVPPVISDETTMWRAWVGFNASHSIGAILFGLIFGFLPLAHPALFFESTYLAIIGFAVLTGLLILSKRYWFHVPFRAIALSQLLYLAGQIGVRL